MKSFQKPYFIRNIWPFGNLDIGIGIGKVAA